MVPKVIHEKDVIKVGKEPMVLLPLKEWERIERVLEGREEVLRFQEAYEGTRNEKGISLRILKKKYNLR